MGIVLVLYSLASTPPARDDRYEVYPDADDAFIAWFWRGNAVYRHLGDLRDLRAYIASMDIPKARDYVRRQILDERRRSHQMHLLDLIASEERLAWLLAGNIVDVNMRELAPHTQVYERPKDTEAARQWVRQEYGEGDWRRERLGALLDLLDGDSNLWLFET